MPGEAGNDGAPVDEAARKEQARAERAAAAAAREQAAVFNEQLGVAIVNSLSRVKVDDRVVKILTAINIASDLDRIAMRGTRYGFPGWVTVHETKRGSKRVYVEQRGDAKAKAAEYLAGAKTAGELAGRTLAVLLMAVYADENAVAHSNRAFHSVSVERALPWADDVAELIDEIASEKLPATLMDPVLEQRRARHAERRAAAAAKAAAIDRIADSPRTSTRLTRRRSTSSSSSTSSHTASTRSQRGSCATRSARDARRSAKRPSVPPTRPQPQHSPPKTRRCKTTSTATSTPTPSTRRTTMTLPPPTSTSPTPTDSARRRGS